MILIVHAVDSDGIDLEFIGDNKVPFWGGHGVASQANYEGLPGKGFAKILFEHYPQFVQYKSGAKGLQLYPAPQWRVIKIKSDTRIPALGTDVSDYDFLLSESRLPITVTSRLIYRETFKNWATMKKWPLNDVIFSKNVIIIQ